MQELSYLMEKRIELLLDMHMKKYYGEVNGLKTQLKDALNHIETLKTNIKNMRIDQLNSQNSAAYAQPVESSSVEPAQETKPAEESSAVQEKCGAYTPEEVSVTKMFYCGGK